MSEYLALLMVTLQVLIFSHLFNEKASISVKNTFTVEIKRKSKNDQELSQYRKLEKDQVAMEQTEIKKKVDTLFMQSQAIPTKRANESTPEKQVKKPKRETIMVMKEPLPVYKTTRIIEEAGVAPLFSKEETMPQMNKSASVPKESKSYAEIDPRFMKIAKLGIQVKPLSVEKICLAKRREDS